MKIGTKEISRESDPYVVAEMSANHANSIHQVMRLMEEAKNADVSAFKLQTYTAGSLTLNIDDTAYLVTDGPWKGRKLYEIYEQGTLPNEWLPDIFVKGKELGLEVFSTPFGLNEVQILENFGVNAYKIASFELTYTQLLREVGLTKKPVILSTGMATRDEISEALATLYESGANDIAILKCTTSYPARFEQLNLAQIEKMNNDFSEVIGFSDHTESVWTGGLAVSHGACILEKHIRLDEDLSSLDASFALPISDLRTYIECARSAKISIGEEVYGPVDEEKNYMRYRRSIVAKRQLSAGQEITENDLAIVRPNIGLAPKELPKLLGRKVKRDISKGEGFSWEIVS